MGVMNLLQTKLETLQIERSARDGAISEQEYEDKIKEAFRQMGIELNEEETGSALCCTTVKNLVFCEN